MHFHAFSRLFMYFYAFLRMFTFCAWVGVFTGIFCKAVYFVSLVVLALSFGASLRCSRVSLHRSEDPSVHRRIVVPSIGGSIRVNPRMWRIPPWIGGSLRPPQHRCLRGLEARTFGPYFDILRCPLTWLDINGYSYVTLCLFTYLYIFLYLFLSSGVVRTYFWSSLTVNGQNWGCNGGGPTRPLPQREPRREGEQKLAWCGGVENIGFSSPLSIYS
jgi:hypothetical protein